MIVIFILYTILHKFIYYTNLLWLSVGIWWWTNTFMTFVVLRRSPINMHYILCGGQFIQWPIVNYRTSSIYFMDWVIESITLRHNCWRTHARTLPLFTQQFFCDASQVGHLWVVRLRIVFVRIVEWEMNRVRSQKRFTPIDCFKHYKNFERIGLFWWSEYRKKCIDDSVSGWGNLIFSGNLIRLLFIWFSVYCVGYLLTWNGLIPLKHSCYSIRYVRFLWNTCFFMVWIVSDWFEVFQNVLLYTSSTVIWYITWFTDSPTWQNNSKNRFGIHGHQYQFVFGAIKSLWNKSGTHRLQIRVC